MSTAKRDTLPAFPQLRVCDRDLAGNQIAPRTDVSGGMPARLLIAAILLAGTPFTERTPSALLVALEDADKLIELEARKT